MLKYVLKLFIYSILFCSCIYCIGQKKIEFGKVTVQDFNDNYKEDFPSANAIVLYRYVENEIGKDIVVHERIKIINELGYDNANVSIPYGDVVSIEGATIILLMEN